MIEARQDRPRNPTASVSPGRHLEQPDFQKQCGQESGWNRDQQVSHHLQFPAEQAQSPIVSGQR